MNGFKMNPHKVLWREIEDSDELRKSLKTVEDWVGKMVIRRHHIRTTDAIFPDQTKLRVHHKWGGLKVISLWCPCCRWAYNLDVHPAEVRIIGEVEEVIHDSKCLHYGTIASKRDVKVAWKSYKTSNTKPPKQNKDWTGLIVSYEGNFYVVESKRGKRLKAFQFPCNWCGMMKKKTLMLESVNIIGFSLLKESRLHPKHLTSILLDGERMYR